MPGIADVKLGRLAFMTLVGADSAKEQVGDPLNADGAIVGAGDPRARSFAPKLPLRASISDPNSRTIAARMRRQIRAFMENDIARLQGAYFQWTVDPELNGWLLLGAADIQAGPGGGITMADWELAINDAYLVGQLRTHRPARTLRLWDRRLSTTPRDILGIVYSTDYASQPGMALHFLPVGVTDALGTGNTVLSTFVRNTLEGALTGLIGQPDSQIVSYEQVETDQNKADVLILDRQTFTAPAYTPAGDLAPQSTYGWEEIYGPNQPRTTGDVAVLQNGLCRVRYDGSNTPGFRVDLYDAGAGMYVEQGKVTVARWNGSAWVPPDTLVSSSVVEWTPDRAVIKATLAKAGDAYARSDIYLTLQRGWNGPRIEMYPGALPNGSAGPCLIGITPAAADTNDSIAWVNNGAAAASVATAGSGAAVFAGQSIATLTGTAENEAIILRQGQANAITIAFTRLGLVYASPDSGFSTSAYGGAARNFFAFQEPVNTGYCSLRIGFHAQQTDQIMEAESITLGTGTTSVADAAASNGNAAQVSRTTDANPHVTRATWPNAKLAKYRVMVRARALTNNDDIRLYAKTAATTGPTRTGAMSSTYAWYDLGDIIADGGTLEIHAWNATAARTFNIDRIEAFKVEDRTAAAPLYDGGRDLGQSALYDARQIPELVARG